MKIRLYQTGDAEGIYNLFTRETSYKRDAAFWVWINRMLSDERSIIVVAEEEGVIVGHYAIIPRNSSIGGVNFKSGLGIHAFIASDFRNVVSIFSITKIAYQVALDRNIDFIYGFPNANYRLIQEKIEKWQKVSIFHAYEKKTEKALKKDMSFTWEKVTKNNLKFYFHINSLLETNRKDMNYFDQSLNYYINRFLHHPQKPYENWLLWKDGICVGSVVTKSFSEGSEQRAHLIHYLLSSEIALSKVLGDFELLYIDRADVFTNWPISPHFTLALVDAGYLPTGFDTFFGVKCLSEKAMKSEKKLLDFNNWELFMSDSDVF